jgi:amidohydrolase
MQDVEAWKAELVRVVNQDLREMLLETSHAIHAQPELAFREQRACATLVSQLKTGGFAVETPVGGLETAFRAELQGKAGPGPTIAILAEYDALPDVGHGCGHNVIASAALGAGLALARTDNQFAGKVLVIGTPAEEGGGGKILLAQAGVLRDADAAMMIHPATRNVVRRGSLANSRVDLTFHGKAAHASSAPDLGVNALEAVIQTFVGINAQRMHLRSDARIHGIITHGGDAVNIIPSRAAARFSVRARDRAYQRTLVERLKRVAEGAASALGARLEWAEQRGYSNMIPNRAVAEAFGRNLQALGREVAEPRSNERMGSTDMGDISQLMPAVHAYLSIAPEGTPGHSLEFAAAARSEAGDAAVLDAAQVLAMTAADLLGSPGLLDRAQVEFAQMLEAGRVAGWEKWLESR